MKTKVLTTRKKLSFTGTHRDLIFRDCIKTVTSNLEGKKLRATSSIHPPSTISFSN